MNTAKHTPYSLLKNLESFKDAGTESTDNTTKETDISETRSLGRLSEIDFPQENDACQPVAVKQSIDYSSPRINKKIDLVKLQDDFGTEESGISPPWSENGKSSSNSLASETFQSSYDSDVDNVWDKKYGGELTDLKESVKKFNTRYTDEDNRRPSREGWNSPLVYGNIKSSLERTIEYVNTAGFSLKCDMNEQNTPIEPNKMEEIITENIASPSSFLCEKGQNSFPEDETESITCPKDSSRKSDGSESEMYEEPNKDEQICESLNRSTLQASNLSNTINYKQDDNGKTSFENCEEYISCKESDVRSHDTQNLGFPDKTKNEFPQNSGDTCSDMESRNNHPIVFEKKSLDRSGDHCTSFNSCHGPGENEINVSCSDAIQTEDANCPKITSNILPSTNSKQECPVDVSINDFNNSRRNL